MTKTAKLLYVGLLAGCVAKLELKFIFCSPLCESENDTWASTRSRLTEARHLAYKIASTHQLRPRQQEQDRARANQSDQQRDKKEGSPLKSDIVFALTILFDRGSDNTRRRQYLTSSCDSRFCCSRSPRPCPLPLPTAVRHLREVPSLTTSIMTCFSRHPSTRMPSTLVSFKPMLEMS